MPTLPTILRAARPADATAPLSSRGSEPRPILSGLSGPVRRAAIVNLGCKVNQSEVEAAGRLLRERGVRIVDERERADLVLVNTCTVTAVADQKSRQAVRRARRASPGGAVVVTGCSVQVDPAVLRAADPAAHIVDNDGKAALIEELAALVEPADDPAGPLPGPLPTLAGVDEVVATTGVGSAAFRSAVAVPSMRIDGISDGRSAADRTRAFVKVQDGCSFHCTYCIIPRARGAERSLPPAAVLADVRRALAAGHREIVLTGINIGTYDGGWSEAGPRGSHARAELTLAGLVGRILGETDVERIRLSSIEPQHVDESLLAAWTGPGAGRCMPHFHLPLQSGDDGVLRRMGRRYDTASYAGLVARLRDRIPGVALHADVIAGFPTEDDAAFERTVAFIASLRLDGLHVFRYSARPGTPATRMLGQVPDAIRRSRAAALLEMAEVARRRHARRSLGSARSVLVEERLPDGRWVGHAEDGQLVAIAPATGIEENALVQVAIEAVDPSDRSRVRGHALAISPGRSIRPSLPAGPVAPPAPRSSAPSLGGARVE
jgi:threonylcarbamoyladenosine tRNA methylthiotransferase MtaB